MNPGYYEPLPHLWLIFVHMERPSNEYHVLSRESFISERNFDNLIREGDARPIHPAFYYICRGIEETAEEFHHIVPRFGHVIKRALNECTMHANVDYATQRCRFFIFDYFARMATRRLVAEYMSSLAVWPCHDNVMELESEVMAMWFEWFLEDEVHKHTEDVPFNCEVSRHYNLLKEKVGNLP